MANTVHVEDIQGQFEELRYLRYVVKDRLIKCTRLVITGWFNCSNNDV